MILVDTSVWVDHLRRDNPALAQLLEHGRAWTHEFVVGELACGNLHQRPEILSYFAKLPRASTAEHGEVMELVERRRLHGVGIGWVDAHLLTSVVLEGLVVWTLDKPLQAAADRLAVAAAKPDFR
ncbi:MAG: PIN domain-containing protein [Gemmatimonadetes bacterium]|nr:PIN domain-containing protein [Gemmatimonadota bacterium]